MIQLSQRDPRWKDKKIGASSLKVGGFGCTLTCLSMLSDYFGCYMDPAAVASQKTWFTPDGLVLWTKLGFEKMGFSWRSYGRSDAMILSGIKNPNTAVMLEVPIPKFGKHWLVAKRKALFRNDYVCQDPWTGKECLAVRDYGAITGSAHFTKK